MSHEPTVDSFARKNRPIVAPVPAKQVLDAVIFTQRADSALYVTQNLKNCEAIRQLLSPPSS